MHENNPRGRIFETEEGLRLQLQVEGINLRALIGHFRQSLEVWLRERDVAVMCEQMTSRQCLDWLQTIRPCLKAARLRGSDRFRLDVHLNRNRFSQDEQDYGHFIQILDLLDEYPVGKLVMRENGLDVRIKSRRSVIIEICKRLVGHSLIDEIDVSGNLICANGLYQLLRESSSWPQMRAFRFRNCSIAFLGQKHMHMVEIDILEAIKSWSHVREFDYDSDIFEEAINQRIRGALVR